MNKDIKNAIRLLEDNNFLVVEMTDEMIKDMNECQSSYGEKDCFGCSCNACIVESSM